MIPEVILNDPMAKAVMASGAAYRESCGRGPTILIPFGSARHDEVMEHARWMDAYVVGNFGQRDRCHHFCCAQAQLHREGFRMVSVGTWIGGFCVRDTMNDGMGTIAGGRLQPGMTQAEAMEWVRKWHAKDPDKRCVIAGYGYSVDRPTSF